MVKVAAKAFSEDWVQEYTVKLDAVDVSVVMDTLLVQRRTWEVYGGMLNATPAERELAYMHIRELDRARENIIRQVS